MKGKIRWLDRFATVVWVYAFIKIFIVDLDRELLSAIGHGATGLLDYRVFFYIGLLVVGVIFLRLWLIGVILYVLFFPLIVLVWKIPAFFIKRRSFLLFMAFVQAVANFFGDFRYNLIAKGLAAIAVVFILATNSDPVLKISAVYLAALLFWSYVRLFKKTFSISSFIETQRKAIQNLVDSDRLASASALGEEYGTELVEYDLNQANQVALKISYGVMINRGLYLWAYQLDRYRRRVSPGLMFNGLSFVWLFLGTIICLALINEAVLKTAPGQFTTEHDPTSFLSVTLYSFATLVLQEAGGIHAVGNIAQSLQLAAALLGVVVIAGFVVNALVTAKRERHEEELEDLVRGLKRRAREHEKRFRDEYSVSVEEAYRRLADLQAGLAFLIRFLMTAVPDDFLTTSRPD